MPVQLVLNGQPKSLGGGFTVRRLLPAVQRQAIGPFVFFDHFGPVHVQPDMNHDVRPHPHIGLATITYLFEGGIMHRDNLGYTQEIEPGAVNWMTAGRGIVHSERRPQRLATSNYVTHGFQLWAALPDAFEETEPGFVHTPAASIPALEVQNARVRVLIGQAFGATSPVATFSPALYLDVTLPANGKLGLPSLAQELAVYPVDNDLLVDGQVVAARTLALLQGDAQAQLSAISATRLLVLGGEPVGHRFMWWNFVSSSKERITKAAGDWEANRFPPVPGDVERIELPPLKLPA